MDKNTLDKVIDILKKESGAIAMAIARYYDVINKEADNKDVDALFEASMFIRDISIEQRAIEHACALVERLYD